MFEPRQAVTRMWTEPGLRNRANTMFELLANVETSNVRNLVNQLAALNEWNELFEMGPYNNFSLSKIKLSFDSSETLEDIAKLIKKRIKD